MSVDVESFEYTKPALLASGWFSVKQLEVLQEKLEADRLYTKAQALDACTPKTKTARASKESLV